MFSRSIRPDILSIHSWNNKVSGFWHFYVGFLWVALTSIHLYVIRKRFSLVTVSHFSLEPVFSTFRNRFIYSVLLYFYIYDGLYISAILISVYFYLPWSFHSLNTLNICSYLFSNKIIHIVNSIKSVTAEPSVNKMMLILGTIKHKCVVLHKYIFYDILNISLF